MRMLIDKTVVVPAVVAGLCALFVNLSPASAADMLVRSPEVTHTGKAPTGYTVTFRYANPTAKKVQIKGEWYFARPSELPQLAATPDHPVIEGQALMPTEWRPGDFPLQKPNTTGPNFPVADMTKDNDGVWTYTIPLPSGTFTYAFMVDCPAPTPAPAPGAAAAPGGGRGQAQCRPISDPNNKPWNEKNGDTLGTVTNNSQVFVPSDPEFNTINYWWQGPAKVKGNLAHVTYPSPGHVTPANEAAMSVFRKAEAVTASTASSDPALKPYQPNQSSPVPSAIRGMLWGLCSM